MSNATRAESETKNETTGQSGQEKSVFIRTYGCQMNVYDSERMTGLLKPLGYQTTHSPEDADLVILNTCHIREKAAEKVYSELGRLKKVKIGREKKGTQMTIAVAGCVAQAEGAEIKARAPQVDMVFGPQAYHLLPEMLAKAARADGKILETDFAVEEKFDRLAETRQHDITNDGPSAFVTIQEGCDKFCTFCVVPYTRGAEVSRSVDAITAEVRALAVQGVREVTLLGQNVNAWHSEPPAGSSVKISSISKMKLSNDGSWGLGHLCRHLAKIDGIERIRFTTSHPRDMNDDLIQAFADEPKLMPYLHLPVQAGSDTVLKAMNRGHTSEHYYKLIARIREARPDIALSGDFIVGFPGESAADFDQTMKLVEDIGYASAYSFKYSRRPGTPGASMAKQVAEPEKDERLQRLQTLLESQKQDFNRQQEGRTFDILLEKPGRHDGQLIGRSPYLQSVHVEAPQSMIGTIQSVTITGVTPNALSGTLTDHSQD